MQVQSALAGCWRTPVARLLTNDEHRARGVVDDLGGRGAEDAVDHAVAVLRVGVLEDGGPDVADALGVLVEEAGALVVAGAADNLVDGVEEAAEAIDKGLANALLNCWIAEGSKQ